MLSVCALLFADRLTNYIYICCNHRPCQSQYCPMALRTFDGKPNKKQYKCESVKVHLNVWFFFYYSLWTRERLLGNHSKGWNGRSICFVCEINDNLIGGDPYGSFYFLLRSIGCPGQRCTSRFSSQMIHTQNISSV